MKIFRLFVLVTISLFLLTSCDDDSNSAGSIFSEALESFIASNDGTDTDSGNDTVGTFWLS